VREKLHDDGYHEEITALGMRWRRMGAVFSSKLMSPSCTGTCSHHRRGAPLVRRNITCLVGEVRDPKCGSEQTAKWYEGNRKGDPTSIEKSKCDSVKNVTSIRVTILKLGARGTSTSSPPIPSRALAGNVRSLSYHKKPDTRLRIPRRSCLLPYQYASTWTVGTVAGNSSSLQ
jgi:hypothetical protein